MGTSTFRLSTSQQLIFAIVFTLALLFAGCTESVTPTGSSSPAVQDPLIGNWINLTPDGEIASTLQIGETQGRYSVIDLGGGCGLHPQIFKVFNVKKLDRNTIRIEVTHYTICGDEQETGEETVFYTLYDGNLQIFGENFGRR